MQQSNSLLEPLTSDVKQEQNQSEEIQRSITFNIVKEKARSQSKSVMTKEDMDLYTNDKTHFFLFINPGSGSRDGKKVLEEIVDHNYLFLIEDGNKGTTQSQMPQRGFVNAKVHFHNIASEDSRKIAFKQIQIIKTHSNVYCIVCGGDGSIMWMINLLIEANIDFSNLLLGTIALGTGNDFSNAMGWGTTTDMKKLINNDFKGLKKLIKQWLNGKTSMCDIWDIDFDIFEGGQFQIIQNINGENVKTAIKDSSNPLQNLKQLNKSMINYFSFGTKMNDKINQEIKYDLILGLDARIGLGFDKNRTQSRFWNKIIYGLEGIKKLFLNTPSVQQTLYSLEELYEIKSENSSSLAEDHFFSQAEDVLEKKEEVLQKQEVHTQQDDSESKQVFQTRTKKTMIEDDRLANQENNLTPEQQQLLNKRKCKHFYMEIQLFYSFKISIVMLQETQIFGNRQEALVSLTLKNRRDQTCKDRTKSNLFLMVLLKIVQFQSFSKLACELCCQGNSERLSQGAGPYVFKFREKDANNEMIQNYFQVDGEYYGVIGLKKVVLYKSKKLKNGQIQVLIEEKKYNKIQEELQ